MGFDKINCSCVFFLNGNGFGLLYVSSGLIIWWILVSFKGFDETLFFSVWNWIGIICYKGFHKSFEFSVYATR